MALSPRAVEELLEFARIRERRSAQLRDAALRAQLDVRPRRACAGQRLTLRWNAGNVAMPVALRIGDEGAWQLVDAAGELTIHMPAHSQTVSMKVGRFLVRRVTVQLEVVPLDWHLLPSPRQIVPFGGSATWGYLAAGAQAVAMRDEGRPWQLLPLAGRIVLQNVFTPRRVELRIRAPGQEIQQTLNAIPQLPAAPSWDRLLRESRAEATALHSPDAWDGIHPATAANMP